MSISKETCFSNIEKAFADYTMKPVWVASNQEKRPINPHTGTYAKCDDPTTWCTFEETRAFITKNPGHLPAIALSDSLKIVAIDIDGCVTEDGKLSHNAQDIINRFQSYSEISVSGKGIHVFALAAMPGRNRNTENLEIYGHSKFITITGDVLQKLPISVMLRQETLDAIYKENFPPGEESQSTFELSPPMSDEAVLELCRKAKNRDKFTALFDKGNLSTYKDDSSAADMALIQMLCFYTQDSDQIDRLMRSSTLKRDKWDTHKTYLKDSIHKSIKQVTNRYQKTTQEDSGKQEKCSWESPGMISSGEDLEVSFPLKELPTVLREAVAEISRVHSVDPALAVLPGLGIAALQIGKKALIEEKRGLLHHASLFLCGVAVSGERKSSCFDGMLSGFKVFLDEQIEPYKKEKAAVKAHNEIIKEQVTQIKANLKSKQPSIDIVTAKKEIEELYTSEKTLPPHPVNFGDDLTPQRLFQKLDEHGGAYGVFSADARGVFKKIIGKGLKDGASEESMYISGMWGDDISRSRVGNNKSEPGGEELIIRKPALTTVCFVQPDLWIEMAKSPCMRQSGLISRINVVIPKSQIGTRLESEKDESLNETRIKPFTDTLIKLYNWKPDKPHIVRLSPEAAARRREFFNTIEVELVAGGKYEDVKDVATKAISLATRLALIIAILDTASDTLKSLESITSVTEEQWLRAQELQEYFFAQSIDAVRTQATDGTKHILAKVARWLKKQKSADKPILVSQIVKGVRGTDRQMVEEKIIPLLIGHCWIRLSGQGRGKVSQYEINPHIFEIS